MNTSNATGAPPALPILNHTLGVGCRPYSASSSSRACAIVLHDPACDPGHSADYLRFYFCSDDPISEALFGGEASPIAPLLKLPLLLFWTTILFASIGVVADHFLAPAVARIARRMKLPEDVAGATLLALGGAAPDIFTQTAALLDAPEPDLKLALSESLGAGVFVATFGQALAILAGVKRAESTRRANDASARGEAAGEGEEEEDDDDASDEASERRSRESTRQARAARRTYVPVEPFSYVRDVVTLATLILLAWACTRDGEVTAAEASAFVVVYLAYVVVVLRGREWVEAGRSEGARGVGRRRRRASNGGGGGGFSIYTDGERRLSSSRAKAKADAGRAAGRGDSLDSLDDDAGAKAVELADASRFRGRVPGARQKNAEIGVRPAVESPRAFFSSEEEAERRALSDDEVSDTESEEGLLLGGSLSLEEREAEESADDEASALAEEGSLSEPSSSSRGGCRSSIRSACSPPPQRWRRLVRWARDQSGVSDNPGSLATLALAPVTLTMSLTMCAVDRPARVSRTRVFVVSVGAPAFFAAAALGGFRGGDRAAWSAAFLVIWAFAAHALAFSSGLVPSAGVDARRSSALQALAFVNGILWMHALADELVGVFRAFGRVAGVRESLLGATVMAWGASAGDLAGIVATSRAGYARMAVTASVAGPLCQLSMGTGLSMVLVKLARGKRIDAKLAGNMRFLMAFGLASCVAYLVAVPRACRWRLGRTFAHAVVAAYAVAVAVFVILALRQTAEP
jgi:sodium/potassium/calcium exchanger 6